MPTLAQSLHDHDLGLIHIIAQLWGIEIEAPNLDQARKSLVSQMLDAPLLEEIFESLPQRAQQALSSLRLSGKRQPWPQFSRRYGEIREMGPNKRDREKPFLNPVSDSEILWYRGLIGRAFFQTPEGTLEFVFLPDDLAEILPENQSRSDLPLSRPATPEERADIRPVNDSILDHACTLLAAQRLGFDGTALESLSADWPMPLAALTTLLRAAGLVNQQSRPVTEKVKTFLELSRSQALSSLVQSWIPSDSYNDLRLIPHLSFEGEWSNDPQLTRQTVLGMLDGLKGDTWWSLPGFIASVKSRFPDFQRPVGDYDTWYIKDKTSDSYLRGFEHWDAVEGELLRQLLTGPLHWLGLIDLAAKDKDGKPLAFRFSRWAGALLEGQPPKGMAKEESKLTVDSKLRVMVPNLAPRALRYLVSRFCEWLPPVKSEYRYRITPASLIKAEEQGLQVKQLLTLLRRYSGAELPPNLVQALKRWQQHGPQANLEQMLVLRVSHPKILNALRESRAGRFLGDPLGATSVVVKAGAWQQVIEALGEMGYLSEIRSENDQLL